MPINFPSTPQIGDTYQYIDRQWTWNGFYWYVSNLAVSTGGGGGGGGGTGLGTRLDVSLVTSNINAGQKFLGNLVGYKSYLLYRITTSAAAWVRIYTGTAAQTSDQNRLLGTDPTPGSGIIAEVLTTGATSQLITPATIGFNDEDPAVNTIYVTVTNQTAGTTQITVTLTINQLES